jgi:molybdate transport system substrate-binding protein
MGRRTLRCALSVSFLALGLLATPLAAQAQDGVTLLAAGSLRAALTEVAEAFTRSYGVQVATEFGASGLLHERLEGGEPGDVFASANMEHPLTLARQGKAGPVVLFARNELCALVRPELRVTESDCSIGCSIQPSRWARPRRRRIRQATTPGKCSPRPTA